MFRAFFPLKLYMVVHELMIKFKEKSSPKQCLPQNPVKKDYKVLIDKLGYAWKFEVYTRSRKGVV